MKEKKGNALKWTIFSIALLLNTAILVESALPGDISKIQSDWMADVITGILTFNDPKIPVERIEIRPKGEEEAISSYDIVPTVEQIFTIDYFPKNTTETSVKVKLNGLQNKEVSVWKSGRSLHVTGHDFIEDVTLEVASSVNEDVTASIDLSVVEKVAPSSGFSVSSVPAIKEGGSHALVVNAKKRYDFDYALRHDSNKLVYSSDNENVAVVDELGIVHGIHAGTTKIKVSTPDGAYSKKVAVTVEENNENVVKPTSMTIVEDNPSRIRDIDFFMEDNEERSGLKGQLSIDWGAVEPSDKGVTWELLPEDGQVIEAYSKLHIDKHTGETFGRRERGSVKVKAISNMDPSIYAVKEIELQEVMPTAIQVNAEKVTAKNRDKYYSWFPIEFTPFNATKREVEIKKVKGAGTAYFESDDLDTRIKGRQSGPMTLEITLKANPSVKTIADINIGYDVGADPDDPESFAYFIRKSLGHMTMFAINAVFSTLAFYLFLKDEKGYGRWFGILILSAIFGFLMAGLSEFFQFLTIGRGPTWADMTIDYLGYLPGAIITTACVFIPRFIKGKREEKGNP